MINESIKDKAIREIEEEDFKDAVSLEKVKIKNKRKTKWYKKLMPFTITIQRRS